MPPRPQERRHRSRPSRAAAVVPAFPRCSCPSCSASRRPLAIPGAGRMRKSQLIEAIEAHQVGGGRQETSAARRGSDQRAASAGADATRPLKQDAMEADAFTRPGIGDGAQVGLGDAARGGIGADGAGQQQLSFYQDAGTAARPDSAAQDSAAQRAAQPTTAQPTTAQPTTAQPTTGRPRTAPPRWPPRAPLRPTRSAATGAAGTASRPGAGTRRPVSSPPATVPPATPVTRAAATPATRAPAIRTAATPATVPPRQTP